MMLEMTIWPFELKKIHKEFNDKVKVIKYLSYLDSEKRKHNDRPDHGGENSFANKHVRR